MPKIAVLISGEYRKLDITRKTMSFLDHPDVDIFVSTWDKTSYSSKKIDLHVEESVTLDRITTDLNRDAVIQIDRHDTISAKLLYNSKMIDRWLTGFKLIVDSGIDYDYVIVMRPDIFFNNELPISLDCLDNYTDRIGFAWATSTHLRRLPDVLFASTFKNMKLLFNSLSVELWNSTKRVDADWHIWWFEFVDRLFPEMPNIKELSHFSFCRYWVNNGNTLHEVIDIGNDWRDLRLLHECDIYGDNFAARMWPNHVLPEAKKKWDDGYFNKYK